ncbi:MAG TPA: helix-turn-helix domain-containing protein [Candidatus Binatia bacterium]|nr:helix-turn-helix domain-containing protein [Candidatus Binatia bacterium]
MPRTRPPDRFEQLIASAIKVFTARGYRRTQMADVAREMGVSPGTLYNYVASKEALFHLLIERAFRADRAAPPAQLPVPTPPPEATLKRLRERLAAEARFPQLDAALARQRVTNARAELDGVVRELYSLVAGNRQASALIERSALDRPELAAVWFGELRRGFLERLTQYLERRIERGHFRPVPDAPTAARLILEVIAWFAWHRHEDAFSRIDDKLAEETTVHFVVSALVREEAS